MEESDQNDPNESPRSKPGPFSTAIGGYKRPTPPRATEQPHDRSRTGGIFSQEVRKSQVDADAIADVNEEPELPEDEPELRKADPEVDEEPVQAELFEMDVVAEVAEEPEEVELDPEINEEPEEPELLEVDVLAEVAEEPAEPEEVELDPEINEEPEEPELLEVDVVAEVDEEPEGEPEEFQLPEADVVAEVAEEPAEPEEVELDPEINEEPEEPELLEVADIDDVDEGEPEEFQLPEADVLADVDEEDEEPEMLELDLEVDEEYVPFELDAYAVAEVKAVPEHEADVDSGSPRGPLSAMTNWTFVAAWFLIGLGLLFVLWALLTNS